LSVEYFRIIHDLTFEIMEEFVTYTEEILSENSCKIMQVESCRIIHDFTFEIMEEFGT